VKKPHTSIVQLSNVNSFDTVSVANVPVNVGSNDLGFDSYSLIIIGRHEYHPKAHKLYHVQNGNGVVGIIDQIPQVTIHVQYTSHIQPNVSSTTNPFHTHVPRIVGYCVLYVNHDHGIVTFTERWVANVK
jgi:hypothetical protein